MLDGPAPTEDDDSHHEQHHRTQHEEFLYLVRKRGLGRIKRMQRHNLMIQPEDFLIVVDLQEDFVPPGLFAVTDGHDVVAPVCDLVKQFIEVGAFVYCSRDYHPDNHCSFEEHGGSFPRHCVQGTHGARFVEPLANVMQHHLNADSGPVFIVYKGFSPDVDSFGAVRYDDEILNRSPRVARRANAPHCSSSWTGSFLLYSSNANEDCNAPPDVMSVLERRTLHDHIKQRLEALRAEDDAANRGGASNPEANAQLKKKKGNLYIVGLALDYCVLDTAVNAASLEDAKELFHSVSILVDYCRPAHVHNIGPFGTGFFTDPQEFAEQCRGKVDLVTFQQPRAAAPMDNPLGQ